MITGHCKSSLGSFDKNSAQAAVDPQTKPAPDLGYISPPVASYRLLLCVIAFYPMHYRYCITWDCFKSSHRALHVLFADCSLSDLMLHFYERINDDDDR